MDTVPASNRGSLGARIKRAREQRGLSQAALAKSLRISTGAVGQWETGRVQPSQTRLDVVASILGVTPAWLAAGVEEPVDPSPRPEVEYEVPISVDAALAREARRLGVDVPAVLDRYLRQIVAEARQKQWLAENHGALQDANAFLERYGLWSDGKRLF